MKKIYICAWVSMLIAVTVIFSQKTVPSSAVMEEPVTKVAEVAEVAEVTEVATEKPQPSETIAEEEALYREGLAAYITEVNQNVTDGEALTMVDCILEQAEAYQMDEKLIMAVAQTESTYYSDAVSCANYKGLMQTGDVLAEEAGYSAEDLFNPEVSIAVGAEYIDDQLETFGDVELALAAYNQGPGAVYTGSYSTEYAELTLQRVDSIEDFLLEEGYL